MINFSSIQYAKLGSEQTATLTISAGVTVDPRWQQSEKAKVQEELKQAIRHHIYGDLIGPLAELADIAQKAYSYAEAKKAAELYDKIRAIINS